MGWESIADFNSGSGIIRVPTAGVPVRFLVPNVAGAGTLFQERSVHAFLILPLPNNNGKMVIGRSAAVRANGVGNDPSGPVLAYIFAPTTTSYQAIQVGVPLAPAALNLINLWVDADVGGNGIIVSYLDM